MWNVLLVGSSWDQIGSFVGVGMRVDSSATDATYEASDAQHNSKVDFMTKYYVLRPILCLPHLGLTLIECLPLRHRCCHPESIFSS